MKLDIARLLGFRIAGRDGVASARIADKVGDKPPGGVASETSA
jgi:hypothetical protein